MVNVATDAFRLTVIFMFEDVLPVIDEGVKLTETFFSCPDADKLIVGEPEVTLAEITTVPEDPRLIPILVGVALSV